MEDSFNSLLNILTGYKFEVVLISEIERLSKFGKSKSNLLIEAENQDFGYKISDIKNDVIDMIS